MCVCDRCVVQHSVQTSNPSRNTHYHLPSPTPHQIINAADTNIEAYARQYFNIHKQRGLFGKTLEVNSLLCHSKVTAARRHSAYGCRSYRSADVTVFSLGGGTPTNRCS